MTILLASLISIGVIVFILAVRAKDLPEPEPVSPFAHLDERKAAIYENLRDLQFEFRVGKLSEADYQQTKLDLQRELAVVMAEVDRIKAELNPDAAKIETAAGRRGDGAKQPTKFVCPSCKSEFAQPLKFCGE